MTNKSASLTFAQTLRFTAADLVPKLVAPEASHSLTLIALMSTRAAEVALSLGPLIHAVTGHVAILFAPTALDRWVLLKEVSQAPLLHLAIEVLLARDGRARR